MAAKTAIVLVASALSLWGHHSFPAEYDSKAPVRLEGTITKFEFVNPHAEIFLDVDGDGWWIEAASPQALMRRGVSKASVRAGMRVTIEGFRAKDGSRRASGTAIALPDGRRLLLRAPE
jgi:hypothetical protein